MWICTLGQFTSALVLMSMLELGMESQWTSVEALLLVAGRALVPEQGGEGMSLLQMLPVLSNSMDTVRTTALIVQ
jgi:hypothetical protein